MEETGMSRSTNADREGTGYHFTATAPAQATTTRTFPLAHQPHPATLSASSLLLSFSPSPLPLPTMNNNTASPLQRSASLSHPNGNGVQSAHTSKQRSASLSNAGRLASLSPTSRISTFAATQTTHTNTLPSGLNTAGSTTATTATDKLPAMRKSTTLRPSVLVLNNKQHERQGERLGSATEGHATWVIDTNDGTGVHTIEFVHGTIMGSRSLHIDGHIIKKKVC